jgi:protein tyrosine phosphatase
MSVKLIEVSGRTYTYQIENTETGVVKTIKRCHYADWKDLSAVSLPALRVLVQEVETLSPNPKDLLWIHCRAGVGRTGSLITALVLKEKIERGEINKENLDGSLMDIIVELRKQRGPAFVQQKDQLDLLRQYADSLIAL